MQRYGGFRSFPNIKARSSWSCCDGVGSRRQKVAKGQNLVVLLAELGNSSYICTHKMKIVQCVNCKNNLVVYPTAFLSESK